MKKRFFLIISVAMLLITSLIVISCGSDDEIDTGRGLSALYGRWMLQGYVSNGKFVSYEKIGARDCYLILEEDGNYHGQFCNRMDGEYSFSLEGEFLILSCISTQVWSTDSDLMFMEEQIGKMKIKSFAFEGNCLNLYYSPNDYLKFSR